MRKLKLIWDFRGPDAEHIAHHHLIHLKEYVVINALEIDVISTECLNELHWISYLVVDEVAMKPIRDRLKPHRGQVYQNP